MLQEEYRALNAQLTAHVAVAQAQRRNTAAAARSASEALNLVNDHRIDKEKPAPSTPPECVAVPVWLQGPPLPVPVAFNGTSATSVNGSPIQLSSLTVELSRRSEGSSAGNGSAVEKVIEAAMHDMHACGEVSRGSEAGRRMLEVRRAAWEAQISCVRGQ